MQLNAAAAAAQTRESKKMNEHARISYLPDSHLFAWLEDIYANEMDWRTNGSPYEVTAADIVADLESDQFDPLEPDWNGIDDDQVTPLWADLGYPLPTDADELAHSCYGITPSDIARAALREYAGMFDVEATAAALLQRLRDEYDSSNSSSSSN